MQQMGQKQNECSVAAGFFFTNWVWMDKNGKDNEIKGAKRWAPNEVCHTNDFFANMTWQHLGIVDSLIRFRAEIWFFFSFLLVVQHSGPDWNKKYQTQSVSSFSKSVAMISGCQVG